MIKHVITTILLFNLTIIDAVAKSSTHLLGDKLPDDLNLLDFKEVGSAKFSVLFWDIYNSKLYTKSGTYSHEQPSEPLIFEIEYLRDITKEQLIARTIEQWQQLALVKSQYRQFIPTLSTIWPDISAGDKLAMAVEQQTATFYFNGKKIGLIAQKEFSKLFLDIWLSPKTSQSKLRAQLLGEIN